MKYLGFQKCKVIDFGVFKKFKEGFFVAFFFFTQLYSLSNNQIYNLCIKNFNENLPGLAEIISEKRKDVGKWFELESALYFDKNDETILGLNLIIEISCLSSKIPTDPVSVNIIDLLPINLTATEFDVVTSKFCIESKSGKFNSKENKSQLLKELNMIKFIVKLKKDIFLEQIDCKTCKNKKGNLNLIVNGILTFNKDVCLKCNWIKETSEKKFYEKWNDLMNLLSEHELCLATKCEINEDNKRWLKENGILYVENLRYDLN